MKRRLVLRTLAYFTKPIGRLLSRSSPTKGVSTLPASPSVSSVVAVIGPQKSAGMGSVSPAPSSDPC